MNNKSIAILMVFAVMFSNAVVFVDDAESAGKNAAKTIEKLKGDLEKHFKSGDYEKASAAASELVKLDPKNKQWYYHLAQTQARLGKKDDAFASLDKVVELGIGQESFRMSMDSHLNPLRSDPRYTALHGKIRSKLPYEKGAKIKGVKTIEDDPKGGLRYRLRMSTLASKENPHRLVIWMHPSGGSSMNTAAEQLALPITKKGFALLVLTQKQFMAWTGEEISALMDGTLKHVDKIEGIDASKPILMGFSAGGQIALMHYASNPENIGGLILHGAFPVVPSGAGGGKWKPMELPASDAIKNIPILTIYGSREGGAKLWDTEAPKWKKAGVPLTVHVVKGGGHSFYLGGKPGQVVSEWLDAVAKGELPGKEPEAKTQNGQEPAKKKSNGLSAEDERKQKKFAELNAQSSRYYKQKDYPQAEKAVKQMIDIVGEKNSLLKSLWYNLACLQGLQNKSDEAIVSLSMALDNGFKNTRSMLNQPALANLRDLDEFKNLIARVAKNQREQAEQKLIKLKEEYSEGYIYEIDHNLKVIFAVAADREKFEKAKSNLQYMAKALQSQLLKHDFEWYIAIVIPTKADSSKGPSNEYKPNIKMLYASETGRRLQHEFTHALHFADMTARGQLHPTWILEGLASSFELSKQDDGRLIPAPTPRLTTLRKAMKKKQVPPLGTFISKNGYKDYQKTEESWNENEIVNYAIACHIIRYLQNVGKLKTWYDAYCAGYKDDPSGLKALEKTLGKSIDEIDTDWRKWVMSKKAKIAKKSERSTRKKNSK